MGKEQIYYPRRIGIVAPRGQSVYEIVVVGEDKSGHYLKILNIVSGHYVNLYSTFTYSDISTGTFLANIVGDFGSADLTAAEMKKVISELTFVKSVAVESMQDVLFERLLFPLTMAGDIRAVVMPVDTLLDRERRLLDAGEGGRDAIYETQRPLGSSLVATLRRYLPWINSEALLGAASDALRALGWGIFHFEMAKSKQERVKVTVHRPITSENLAGGVSYSVVGIAAGVMEGIYGVKYTPMGKVNYDVDAELMEFELGQTQAKTKAD